MGPKKATNRGFSLVELIVVITIIVLVLGIIVPVVNTLNANRGLANAKNEVAAYVAMVRGDAIQYQRPMGVCFYLDPVNQQCTMVEVEPVQLLRALPGANPPVNEFPVWSMGSIPDANIPLDIAGDRVTISRTQGTLTPYREPFTLPKCVGIAMDSSPTSSINLVKSPGDIDGSKTKPTTVDRLQRMGVIMFGPNGNILPMVYGIPLGNAGAVTTVPIPSALGAKVMYGQAKYILGINTASGLIIYDHDQYISQSTTSTTSAREFADGDFFYAPQWAPRLDPTDITGQDQLQKRDEENWIYGNGVAMTVNPFNGSVMIAK